MSTLEKTLFQGVSNTVDITLSDKDGVPIPFDDNGVTLMELYINDQKLSSSNGDISWDNNGGVKIESSSNTESISNNVQHSVSLVVYDPLHPEPDNGQLLINRYMKYSDLSVRVVNPKL